MSGWHDPWMGSQNHSGPANNDEPPFRTSTPHPSSNRQNTAPSANFWSTSHVELEDWLSDDVFAAPTEGDNTNFSFSHKTDQILEYPPTLQIEDESQEQDFSNFSQWIGGLQRPKVPCVLCRVLKLQCILLRTGEANPNPDGSCASCVALFRECSFAPGEKRQPATFEMPSITSGHLHGVTEEDCDDIETKEAVDQVEQSSEALNTIRVVDKTRKSRGDINNRRGYRFQRSSRNILKKWYSEHQGDPYPTENQKMELSTETGLSKKQINDWFSNTRRHQQKKDSTSSALIGNSDEELNFSNMSPMQRWCNSPPDHEPLPINVVNDALNLQGSMPLGMMDSNDFRHHSYRSQRHAVSVSSMESGESSYSNSSASSAWSNVSHTSKLRRRRQKMKIKTQSQSRSGRSSEGPYKCLFCGKPFKKKYDWQRHEKSIHLPLETWVCAPENSGTFFDKDSGQIRCAFCRQLSPTDEHMNSHDLDACISRSSVERTFLRKDHFRQHIRKFHGGIDPDESVVESCRVGTHDIISYCGFCGAHLSSWNARIDHIAVHFEAGLTLADWTGGWGLDAMVEQSVRDFVPLNILRGESTPMIPHLLLDDPSFTSI